MATGVWIMDGYLVSQAVLGVIYRSITLFEHVSANVKKTECSGTKRYGGLFQTSAPFSHLTFCISPNPRSEAAT